MPKHEPKSERKVVNNAIQYYTGFIDALEWLQSNPDDDLDGKIDNTKELLQLYRKRLHSIMLEEGNSKSSKSR